MKKWLIGLIVPALIGSVPVNTYAATGKCEYPSVKFGNGVVTVRQYQPECNHPNYGEPRMGNNDPESNRWNKDGWGHRRRDRDHYEDRRWKQERDDARYVINRTASVIFRAQRIARIGHYYHGLARSIAHQNRARELFRAGRYREAIFHSLRGRRLAMNVIRGNRENWAGYSRNDREERYGRMAPKDNDLDVRIDWSKVGNDDAVVNIQFHLNVD